MRALPPLQSAIESEGLAPRGIVRLEFAERVGALADVRAIALVGMTGSANWPAFANSPEAADGAPHPLDRWSRRVIGTLARRLDANAIFPFDGPPYLPFQAWARRAEPLWPSPLGMLIHPEFGLWHSYRGALTFADEIEAPPVEASASPCETCAQKPCLSACPVGAFTASGYDVAGCAAHVHGPKGRACLEGGCLARRACPVGRAHAHGEDQARFHMRAFLAARRLNP
jgi:hypothetical protein